MDSTSRLLLLAALSLLLLTPFPAAATTWNVPGHAATIQGGIDLASPGDTVLVGPGMYSGAGNVNLSFGGVDRVLRSSAGRDQTTIDCGAAARGLVFNNGETASAVVEGFTIRNGYATTGGGLLIDDASPVIRNCRFVHCYASSHGGAADLQEVSAPQFIGCVFDSNSTSGDYHTAGAVYVRDDASFTDCTFRHNQAGGIGGAVRMTSGGDADFASCVFEDNAGTDGGAIAIQSATTVDCDSCSFSRNYASSSGGAIMVTGGLNTFRACLFDMNSGDYGGTFYVLLSDAVLENCTVARSTSIPTSAALSVTNSGSDIDLTNTIVYGTIAGAAVQCLNYGDVTPVCTNLYGNEGGDWDISCGGGEDTLNGNFSLDPLFCDPNNGDFTLNSNSPCLDAPGCGLVGAFGQGCDPTGVGETDRTGLELLGPAIPNPFGSATNLSYTVPEGATGDVRLTIHDVQGRMVRELVDRRQPAGRYAVSWDGRNQAGRPVAGGVYFYRLELHGMMQARRMILLR